MAEKRKFKNKQKCQKSLTCEKLHARKLPLLQYMENTEKSQKLSAKQKTQKITENTFFGTQKQNI